MSVDLQHDPFQAHQVRDNCYFRVEPLVLSLSVYHGLYTSPAYHDKTSRAKRIVAARIVAVVRRLGPLPAVSHTGHENSNPLHHRRGHLEAHNRQDSDEEVLHRHIIRCLELVQKTLAQEQRTEWLTTVAE